MFLMIWLIGILVLLKSLAWSYFVPVFQTPDEQAHFTQLSFIVENKTLLVQTSKNLSLEIAITETLLGTRRDDQGNNNYTYHPEYKNNSLIPLLPLSYRTIYLGHESANYPPAYYVFTVPLYLATYTQSIYWRIMASRILPIIFQLFLFITAYKIGQTIWEDKLRSLVLAIATVFQPMISFVAAGIHPDNLLNLFCSLMVLISILVIKNKIKIKYLLLLGILMALSVETKQTVFFFLPAVFAAVIWKKIGMVPALGFLLLPVAAFIFRWNIQYMPYVGPESPLAGMDFWQYLHFRLPKLAFEMWPWYWGVFKWLGVTLPALWMKIITRIAVISILGLIIKFFREKRNTLEFKILSFFVICNFSFIIYMFLWDWRLMQSMGYSQGLQGRYLFPAIVPQMALFLVGFWSIGKLVKLEKFAVILSAILMISLNIGSLIFVSKLY